MCYTFKGNLKSFLPKLRNWQLTFYVTWKASSARGKTSKECKFFCLQFFIDIRKIAYTLTVFTITSLFLISKEFFRFF